MARIIIAYVSTLLVFAAVDFVWLTQMGPLLYNPILGPIMAAKPRMDAAVAFYLLYIAGLLYFAVLPGLKIGCWKATALKGALFGLFAYATYDLTNQATLIIWSSKITVADMLWGSFVSAVGSVGGYLVTSKATKSAA